MPDTPSSEPGAQINTSPPTSPFIIAPALPTIVQNTPAAPLPPACPDAPRTRLILNERGYVLEDDIRPLNVRLGPGTGFRAIDQLEIGSVFAVVDGPRCGGEYAWFRVRAPGLEGWIAEGDASAYFVSPYLPG